MMKLLVVSHPCATPCNQGIFAAIGEKTGWEVTLVIPASWKDEFGNRLDEKPLPEFSGPVIRLPVVGNGNIVLHVYRSMWGKLLGRGEYDLLYMHHEPYALATAQVCLANRRMGRPAVFGFYSAQNLPKRYPPPFCWIEREVFESSRFAFPVSEAVGLVLAAKGCGVPLTVCPLPVDPARYFPRAERAGVAGRESVLGYVGRLVEAKGLRTLASALGMLRDLDWRMEVVGDGDFRGEFERLLRAEGVEGRVAFRGFVPHDETPEMLRSMDVVIVPSETQAGWKEQFGRIVVEAMACGAMVVGSDSGEIPRLLTDSGGGLIFAERNPRALAERLREAIVRPQLREMLASDGGAWVRANVSTDVVAERMAGAMEDALRAGPRCS